MGSFRHGAATSNIETPLLIIGCVLLVLVLLAILQRQLRQQRKKKYHPPLDLTSNSVIGQIHRRKEDLQRFIGKLQTQLAAREQQLRLHNQLEEIVTARVQTSRKQEDEWEEIMRAGRKVHGKSWTAADGDELSLKELMEHHKDELLEYKASIEQATKRDRTSRRAQVHQTFVSLMSAPLGPSSRALLATSTKEPAPQWQSTRRLAGQLSGSPRTDATLAINANPWSKQQFPDETTISPSGIVPKLDLSQLGSSTSAVPVEPTAQPIKKSFAKSFERQAKLASTLKKKH